jgi:hypothetical protein
MGRAPHGPEKIREREETPWLLHPVVSSSFCPTLMNSWSRYTIVHFGQIYTARRQHAHLSCHHILHVSSSSSFLTGPHASQHLAPSVSPAGSSKPRGIGAVHSRLEHRNGSSWTRRLSVNNSLYSERWDQSPQRQ